MTEPTADPGANGVENLNLEGAMEHYQAALLRYAARVLNNEDAAQDVVQETFIRLHGNWDKLTKRGVQLKGWLYRTAHNAAVDYIRRESRLHKLHERQAQQAPACSFDSDRQRDAQERQALVMEHLNALKPKEREVLILRLQEGMSYKEIAAVLKRSDGYVGTLIHNATKKLTRNLKQAGVVS